MSQMRKLRLREIKQLVQGNPASKGSKVEILNLDLSDSRYFVLSIVL